MLRSRTLWTRRARRRGTALVLVLLMTVTIAAIAMSAILLTGSGTMLTKYYDRERDFRYAAEAALAMGKAQITKDTTVVLPDSGYVTLMSGGQIIGADGQPIPRVHVNLYAGMTGNTTGQFGKFASVVAEAYDASGTHYVRRLEMQAENFARFAMFTNTWPGGLCYATGEFIRGRGHSNQGWQSCGSPTYYDTISAVNSVTGGSPTYMKGYINGAQYIPIPPVSRLAALHTYAQAGNMDIVPQGTSLANVKTRLEFVAVDLNNDGNVTDDNEGFFRVYQGGAGANATQALRVDANSLGGGITYPPLGSCGDWHDGKFYPIGVHNQNWFKNTNFSTGNPNDGFSGGMPSQSELDAIMRHAGARCYSAGDPHLVATERSTVGGYPPVAWQKGGEDTTFTDSTQFGHWVKWGGNSALVIAAVTAGNPAYLPQAQYLWPLHRSLNPTTKGVIHVHGPILISGVLRGRVTLYAQTTGAQRGYIGFVDDLVYAQDPASVLCANLFGTISDNDQMILDNGINSPQRAGNGWPYRWTDGNDNGMLTANDFVFHGVTMSRTGTVGVENFSSHPENLGHCNGANSGRGCIRQAGGVIENNITATFTNSGDGYGENRSVDACMSQQSPPYYPYTGRYIDNRYYEIDPARFNVSVLFQNLQGGF